MSNAATNNSSAVFCADEVRVGDFGRYAATLFSEPEQRRALLGLYAFNIEVAGVRDHISQPLPGEIRLQWWIDTLKGDGHDDVQGHPIAAELLNAVKTYNLPVDDLVRLVDAYRFDLYDDPMLSMDALESYVANSDSMLLSLAARIYARHMEKPAEAVHDAGLAQGLARIIARLPIHAARRQLYLPQQLLEMNAVAVEDIFSGQTKPELRIVLTYLSRTARAHLDKALDHLAAVPPEQRGAFLPLALVAKALERIERADFDPFRQPQPSRLSVLWRLWRASHHSPFID